MEICKGKIVMSRVGRDRLRWYIVVGQEQDRVLLANGEKFTLANPKKKNYRHISCTNMVVEVQDMQTDTQLKQVLQTYKISLENAN